MRRVMGISVLLLVAVAALAQVRGIPPSVTSLRPGFPTTTSPPPSVTSMGPFGWQTPFSNWVPNSNFPRHRRFEEKFGGGVISLPLYAPYPYPVFYPMAGAVPEGATGYDEPDPNLPTNAGAASRDVATGAPPVVSTPVSPPPADSSPDVSEQEATVLVFRDGHQLEVHNYAIVGNEVYNFSGPGPRRIALSDLDIGATRRANDDRGVFFRLPITGSN